MNDPKRHPAGAPASTGGRFAPDAAPGAAATLSASQAAAAERRDTIHFHAAQRRLERAAAWRVAASTVRTIRGNGSDLDAIHFEPERRGEDVHITRVWTERDGDIYAVHDRQELDELRNVLHAHALPAASSEIVADERFRSAVSHDAIALSLDDDFADSLDDDADYESLNAALQLRDSTLPTASAKAARRDLAALEPDATAIDWRLGDLYGSGERVSEIGITPRDGLRFAIDEHADDETLAARFALLRDAIQRYGIDRDAPSLAESGGVVDFADDVESHYRIRLP